jgi:hypothetical protein
LAGSSAALADNSRDFLQPSRQINTVFLRCTVSVLKSSLNNNLNKNVQKNDCEVSFTVLLEAQVWQLWQCNIVQNGHFAFWQHL